MKASTHIMVVDDEETICEALMAWFIKDGYKVETALSGAEALALLEKKDFDIFLVDVKMPGMDGIELLSRIKEKQPEAVVIMMTAHGSIQTAVEAMKRGAGDYLCKPFDPDSLSLLMERVMNQKKLRKENIALKERLLEQQEEALDVFIVHSDPMRKIFSTVDEVAPSSAPILITGETGVGKDLVARAIHLRSQRSFGPFVAVNCGALSESLLESELFGHEKGAFTGAVKARRGCLEMADSGTLFLDEIGEISTKMQISLLRVLEEKRFLRLGGSNAVSSDFRLVTATHRDLPPLIKENQFREDFYYRINVITIHIPPLRERKEDIPVLSDHFLKRFVEETGKHLEGFTAKALEQLISYSWPGNVRELKNVIERAVVIARGRMIGAEELKFLDPGKPYPDPMAITLEELEKSHIISTLASCDGNISRTAKKLGINRSTLSRKMNRYRLVGGD
ncbi:MAG: sigma-54-dependent Fis family transcriptional regulator [Deltaproteobacteria bacterium]|jgi:two-component system response regulator HydG|nr:sigma-54-dependent Fis family transcriptional regulator [Deltaproteobacteria bacterium]